MGVLFVVGLGLDFLLGLIVGFIIFFGGYGMGVVWVNMFVENYGFVNMLEIVMVFVIFGLIIGGIIGSLVV